MYQAKSVKEGDVQNGGLRMFSGLNLQAKGCQIVETYILNAA